MLRSCVRILVIFMKEVAVSATVFHAFDMKVGPFWLKKISPFGSSQP